MEISKEAIEMVIKNIDKFRPGFPSWICDNFEIYEKFESHARIIAQKRSRYSARTIIEFIRHHTALHDKNGELKIDNCIAPDLARLFALLNPKYALLFEFRTNSGRYNELSSPAAEGSPSGARG